MKLVNVGIELRKPLSRVINGSVVCAVALLLVLLAMANESLRASPAGASAQAGPTTEASTHGASTTEASYHAGLLAVALAQLEP